MSRTISKTYLLLVLITFGVICIYPAVAAGQTPEPGVNPVTDVRANTAVDRIASGSQATTVTQLEDAITQSRPDIQWSLTFGKVLWAAAVFIIAFMAIKYFTAILEKLSERWSHLRLLIKRMIPIIRVISWTFIVYIIIADIFAPPIQTLIAVTASAGIAIGFASQDILKNIFGGVMIILDRPFQVGDKIGIGSYYGEVVQIGLRSVRIVTPDDSIVTIPNGVIVNQYVSNANSGEFYCQVVSELFIPPDVDLEQLRKIGYRAAAVSRYIYLDKPITVVIKNEVFQGRSMLVMRLKAYVFDIRYEFPFASDMTETVLTNLLHRKLISAADLAFVKEKT